MTTLVVSLDPEGTASSVSRRPARRGEGMHVSLLRCVALTRHLKNILGAVQRAAQASNRLTLTINRYRVSLNGDASEVMVLDASSELRRLRTRLVKAVEPGIIAIDTAPSISDFRSRKIGPMLVPEFGGNRVSSRRLRVSNVSVSQIDEASYKPQKLLGRWPLSRQLRGA